MTRSDQLWHERGKRFKADFLGHNDGPKQFRGARSEERFAYMTKTLQRQHRLKWLNGIAWATTSEDCVQGIDFRLRAIAEVGGGMSEFSILIQVKSSTQGAVEFRKENPGTDVHLVVMDRRMTLDALQLRLYLIYRKESNKRRNLALAV